MYLYFKVFCIILCQIYHLQSVLSLHAHILYLHDQILAALHSTPRQNTFGNHFPHSFHGSSHIFFPKLPCQKFHNKQPKYLPPIYFHRRSKSGFSTFECQDTGSRPRNQEVDDKKSILPRLQAIEKFVRKLRNA